MDGYDLMKTKIDGLSVFFEPYEAAVRLFKDPSVQYNLSSAFDMDDNFLADDLVDDHRIHAEYPYVPWLVRN